MNYEALLDDHRAVNEVMRKQVEELRNKNTQYHDLLKHIELRLLAVKDQLDLQNIAWTSDEDLAFIEAEGKIKRYINELLKALDILV